MFAAFSKEEIMKDKNVLGQENYALALKIFSSCYKKRQHKLVQLSLNPDQRHGTQSGGAVSQNGMDWR